MTDTIQENDRVLFNRIAAKYARKDRVLSTRAARSYQLDAGVAPVLRDKKIGTVVEIACGIGASAQYLGSRYERYVGVDHSEELIRHAQDFHRGRLGVEFMVKNVKELKAGDTPPADLVLAVGALHHFTEINLVLRSIATIAKPGSFFVAIEPQSKNPIIQFLRFVRTKIDHDYSADQHFFTGQEVRELLERHKFTDIDISYQGYFSPPFAQVIIPPQALVKYLSYFSIWLDRLCDKFLPEPLRFLSWNIIIRAKFPI